jgi:ABC-2 type transport system ATP-binding protein
MHPAIRVEDLWVDYKTKKGDVLNAVRGLTFEVQPGEIVGFLGPNGAGKSSTLKALMGFVTQKSGTAEVFGKKAGIPESRREIGYLPEVAMYYPFLTPTETLQMYGELQGLNGKELGKEISDLLELVGISHAAKKLNRSMSKGMLQRVGIAQSLLGNPRLLILDEVTSGLDPVGRKQLRNLLKDRQKQGTTLFFSSHELSEVDMLCDRILLIHKGQLVEQREMHELKDDLRHFEIEYKGEYCLVGLTENSSEIETNHFRASFQDKTSLLKAVTKIQAQGGEIIDVVAQEGNLEDYFIEKVEQAA